MAGKRILVVGGGELGAGLTARLAAAHEVVVVDHLPAVADRFTNLDVGFVLGNGTSPETLRRAGAAGCDYLVAATGVDEVNVLASLIGRRLGAGTTICVVSRDDLIAPLEEGRTLREELGIDRVIWPEAQLAEDIERIIAAPGAIDAETFEDGRISLLEYRVDAGSPLASGPLASLRLPRGVLAVAVRRGAQFSIPHGSTALRAGDKVFLMGTAEAMAKTQKRVVGQDPELRQVITIVGGGDVGFRLARRLEERTNADVRIVERDPGRGAVLAAALRRTLVLNGDGTDLELLEAEDIGRSDVLVSVIDNDERNLFASMLARQLGVSRVITRVSRAANLRLFERVGVDVALSARGAAIAAIAHLIQGGQARLLAVLEEGQAQVVEIRVPASFAPTRISDLRTLPASIVGALVRQGVALVPGGEDTIQGGDRLLVFTTTADSDAVREYFVRSS
jgi:trk system potassium uptake protein TrkA